MKSYCGEHLGNPLVSENLSNGALVQTFVVHSMYSVEAHCLKADYW